MASGGVRIGAGRKKLEPTSVMRVPAHLVEYFKELIAQDKHRSILKVSPIESEVVEDFNLTKPSNSKNAAKRRRKRK